MDSENPGILNMVNDTMKYGRWFLFLTGCVVAGCVSGPQPPKGSWPWEHAQETGNYQTGDYIAISGNVANFGEAPKVVKPVIPESREPYIPGSSLPSERPGIKSNRQLLAPADGKGGVDKSAAEPKSDYDFTVQNRKVAAPAYMPMDSVRATYEMIACNHGNAPVSVAIGFDPDSSENISIDKVTPLTAVVPPKTDQVLLHFAPKMKNEAYSLRAAHSWTIGDYTARHHCPEHYQFPFGNNIRAFASVSNNVDVTPYTRYAVIFSMPVGTSVLAARKGRVIQVEPDRVDILHDDSTIGSYSHLDRIAEGMIAGKTVSTRDILGTAGTAGNRKEAYIQFTVWRPEPMMVALQKNASSRAGFNHVSFPLEFCGPDSGDCRVLTRNQPVSRNKLTESTKQRKRTLNPISRHNTSLGKL